MGLSLKLGGIIPISADTKIIISHNNLGGLHYLYGKENILPLVPNLSRSKLMDSRKISFVSNEWIEPTVDKLISLAKIKPNGLSSNLQELGKKFLDIYAPIVAMDADRTTALRADQEGKWNSTRSMSYKLFAGKLGLHSEEDAENLIKAISITRNRTIAQCLNKMEIEYLSGEFRFKKR
jgi:hypothetical protein